MMTLNHDDNMHPLASREAEPPPPPPSVTGNVTLRMGDTTSEVSLSQLDAEDFWPVGSTSDRQVVLVQLTDSDEFAAFGIFPSGSTVGACCKVPFVVWGKVSADLDGFLQKMAESGAEAGWFSPAPLDDMQTCVSDIEEMSAQRRLLAAVDWKQEPSNKDTYARTAA